MEFPNLPLEILAEVCANLPREDVLNFALTNRTVHDVTIGGVYRHTEISAIYGSIFALNTQKCSMECMRALMADEKKRHGVESLRFHGIGMIKHDIDDLNAIPEPYCTLMQHRRDEWDITQPLLIELVHTFLSGNFEFPKLRTILYDADALLTERDVERLLAFIRRHPEIQNVIIEGDNTGLFNRCTFSRLPDDLVCRLANLERAIIYGPLLPLLLGFSFSPSGTPGVPGALSRSRTMPDMIPLKRVHIWWPQRCVRVVKAHRDCPAPAIVDLDILDVIEAIGVVCGSSLEVLFVGVDEDRIDGDLLAMISYHFPNMRELYFGPARSDPMTRVPNQHFMQRVASTLSPLKHLVRFTYCDVSRESDQYADVLHLTEDWNDTARSFLQCCPSLQYWRLYSHAWRRSVETVPANFWG